MTKIIKIGDNHIKIKDKEFYGSNFTPNQISKIKVDEFRI